MIRSLPLSFLMTCSLAAFAFDTGSQTAIKSGVGSQPRQQSLQTRTFVANSGPNQAVMTTPDVSGAAVVYNPPYPMSNSAHEIPQVHELDKRIAMLESARQDLSAWATIFVSIVAVLLAANVTLSVLQVRTLARKEAEKAIIQYDKQFNGFLMRGQDTIADKLGQYEASIAELTRRIREITTSVDQCSAVSSDVIADMQRETTDGILRLETVGRQLRADLTNHMAAWKASTGTSS